MSICEYYDMSSSSCVGAKYCPKCFCKGDTTVCDFYPDKRTSSTKDTHTKSQHNPEELTLIHKVAIRIPNDPTIYYLYVVETLIDDDKNIFNYLRLNKLADAVKSLYGVDEYTIVSEKVFPLSPVVLINNVSNNPVSILYKTSLLM